MKVRIPLMIQDPCISEIKGMKKLTEGFELDEPFYLDGPVSRQVAVVDISPTDGTLQPCSRFTKTAKRKTGYYTGPNSTKDLRKAEGDELYKPEFLQVSVFATVLKTIYMFKEIETIGRELSWSFKAPQLLVVPRAGEWANAYYSRDTHSLQFFFFYPKKKPGKKVYTCLSRDIVSHETGHAIIDGIAPDLAHASTPQALAMHEGIADLTALLMAFQSKELRSYVLKNTRGSIDDTTAFSAIGEEVGQELLQQKRGLRNLHNDKTLNPADKKHFVSKEEPHYLSEVLSGALYNVLEKIYDSVRTEYAKRPKYKKEENPEYSASGAALWEASKRFKRMIFRGLDCLPPGDVSFADFGRAMMAVDQIAYPADSRMRVWLCEQFKKRHIIENQAQLAVETVFDPDTTSCIDSSTLCSSDWLAYDFVNKNRDLFCIPITQEPIPFEIRPRLEVRKKYDKKNPRGKEGHECIFKVAWSYIEDNKRVSSVAAKRKITVGTTLILDFNGCKILARITNAPPNQESSKLQKTDEEKWQLSLNEYERQRESRDRYLSQLIQQGALKIGNQAFINNKKTLMSSALAEVKDGVMCTRGMVNLLHMIENRAGKG
jgi:hypothetical protein